MSSSDWIDVSKMSIWAFGEVLLRDPDQDAYWTG